MNKIIKEAMRVNRFYNKATNFKELWQSVDEMIDWKFHKMVARELEIAWYEIDSVDEIEVLNTFNSYNSSSSFTFLIKELKWRDIKFLALCFHRGGDVRGNYGDLIFINQDTDSFLMDLSELILEFDNYGFSWFEYPFVGESGVVYGVRAHKRSDAFNEKLDSLEGYYYENFPKGFVTAYEKTCC